MGEEAKQAEAKASEAPKQEEKPATEKKEEKEEEKEEEAKPSPPPPVVIFVDLHCVGCAKKIERSILKCRGVEEVEMKIEKNEVTVKGIVDPQALCARIQKKTSRNAKVLSPLPPPVTADSTKAPPPPPPPQGGGIATVELRVNMHCEACAQQLRKKIMKMRGVQAAETDLSAKKVTVTGTMNGDKLVEYIYRRTGKIAAIIPPPPPPLEEKKYDGEKKAEDTQKPPEEKKDDAKKEESDDKKPSEGNKEEKTASGESGADEQSKKEEAAAVQAMTNDEEMVKRMMYWNAAGGYNMMNQYHDDEMSKRMMMMHHWMPMHVPTPMPATMYVFDRPQLLPPPQMFSDENPNACSIS